MLIASYLLHIVLWSLFQLLVSSSSAVWERDDIPSWHQYVRAPSSSTVTPKKVLAGYSNGNVTNAGGLVDGSGTTYLSRSENSSEVPTVVVDFGQNVVGLLTIDFVGAKNYTHGQPGIKLIFSETLEFLADKSDFSRSDNGRGDDKITNATDQIAVKSEPYTWTNQWGCEFSRQVCSDGLHGFRYVKIALDALPEDSPHTTSFGEVGISSVKVQFYGFLGTPDTFTGTFECSDKDLTQWWYDGSYTSEMCIDVFRANDTELRDATSPSLVGKLVIHDGAKRDRDPYMGDLAVSALTSYLTHDVEEVARNVMEDLVQHQRSDGWIPPASINNYGLQLFDYPLWWVSCSYEHVMHTGNLSYIESYYPNMTLLLDTYYPQHTSSSSGLLVRQEGYGDYAFIPRDGSAAYYSALYVLSLTRAAALADFLLKPDDASRWRDRAATVSKSFVTELWDPEAEAFFDRKCTGKGCAAHAQDGNSLAIIAGIANDTLSAKALNYLNTSMRHEYGNSFYDAAGNDLVEEASDRVYAFISYFEMSARFASGHTESALDLIRRTYGWMASHDPGITFWEGIGKDGGLYEDGFTSMAHGWSTGIVPLLSTYVLGVSAVKPGFDEWSVKPRTGGLEGGLRVRWQRNGEGSGESYNVWVHAPKGTNGSVSVPWDGKENEGKEVHVDGNKVYDGKGTVEMGAVLEDGWVRVGIQGGEEHVVGWNGTASG
ncbi:family 78 glycoside hydrolase [Pseudomassariella vexata]|uniref:Family 78 glycoside hydrolase n=1 Tax=Pseudomassariella vexata TaxID=1141098 RepID=A0A1Y2EDX4_9PEZI|nr:family 78 glycoside hydrolase [Pseudomassariella vexata]ORY69466.1 family 78 glycoside hydrolase [Pseudomassariella vexata]